MKKTSALQMFACFQLGKVELAISAYSVQEVVNAPESLSSISQAPPYVLGLFNLRGLIIPVLDVATLLGAEKESQEISRKVAIICSADQRIGLLFDGTSEILNVEESLVSHFKDEPIGHKALIRSILKLEGGDRLIEVVDVDSVFKIPGLPEVTNQVSEDAADVVKHNYKRRQCITFHSADLEFGIDISSIREIIRVPEIKRSVLAVDDCIGMVNLRGIIIPLLNFQSFLKLSKGKECDRANQRIVILNLQGNQVGFLVESVDSIVSFFAEEVLPLPSFENEKKEMMTGVVPDQGERTIILLNETKLLSDKEIADITRGHATLYGRADSLKENKVKKLDRKTYLSFKLLNMLSARLNTVDEIAKLDSDLMQPPGYPSYVLGMMNMRGQMVMIIDLRTYYSMPAQTDRAESRVLIVKGVKGTYGLLVDSVESIDTVDESQKIKLPQFLVKDIAKTFQGDMAEVAEMIDLTGKKKTFMILDIPELLRKLEAAAA